MFIDFRTVPDDSRFDADVCVIGGGAAGITLARELVGSRIRVLLLESAGFEFDPEIQAMYAGRNVGRPYYDLDVTRLRFFGGSTNHWNNRCGPLTAWDMSERPWVPYSGWPISREELQPYYERASPICGAGPYVYNESLYDRDDFVFGGHRRPDGFTRFEPSDDILRHYYFHNDDGSPIHFGEAYRDELEAADNVEVLLYASVANLQANDAGTHVEWVDVASLDGKRARATARVYALCCGGLENARLLLCSDTVVRAGLGNQNDLVGRFFMEHPTIKGTIVLPEDPSVLADNYSYGASRAFVPALTLSEAKQEEQRLLSYVASLETYRLQDSPIESLQSMARAVAQGRMPRDPARTIVRALGDVETIAYNLYRRAAGYARVPDAFPFVAQGENAPNPDSRVSLTQERDALGLRRIALDWRIGELERRSMAVLLTQIGEEFARLGFGRLRLDPWLTGSGDLSSPDVEGGHHHMGTTRMADDPQLGVVDRNCRVHGIDNLYIGGSSVFSTTGFANPTLTIVALALRLADRFQTQLA